MAISDCEESGSQFLPHPAGVPRVALELIVSILLPEEPAEPSSDLLLGYAQEHPEPFGFQSRFSSKPGVSGAEVNYRGNAHLCTIAATGTGKGRNVLIPTLLTYRGSVVVFDPKGENYQVTARRRREMGQRVVLLDPFRELRRDTDSLNALDLFSLPGADLVTDAQMLAAMLSDGQRFSKDPFWDTSATALVAAVMVYVATQRPPEEQTLTAIREFLYADDLSYRLAVILDTVKDLHPFVYGEFAAFLQHPERETRPSVLSTVLGYFKPLFSDRVSASIGVSTFPLSEVLSGQPVSIYIVLPARKLTSHRRLLRLWMATLLTTTQIRERIPLLPTLFLLDEAAQLGEFEPLVQALTLGRGFGVKVWSFWQDLSQLKHLYPQIWPTLINNCGVKQVFGINDPFMAHGLDELLNIELEEILSLRPDEQFLVLGGSAPLRARRLDYLRDPRFEGLSDPNPRYGGRDEDCDGGASPPGRGA
jgi:type IV secretion system protein VirD4